MTGISELKTFTHEDETQHLKKKKAKPTFD